LTDASSICELMLWEGRAALAGDEGTTSAATAATTIEVGRSGGEHPAELVIRNARAGKFRDRGIRGQITAHGPGRVRLEDVELGHVTLITRDDGRIDVRGATETGQVALQPHGGPISWPSRGNSDPK
jgi:hypothetical protein